MWCFRENPHANKAFCTKIDRCRNTGNPRICWSFRPDASQKWNSNNSFAHYLNFFPGGSTWAQSSANHLTWLLPLATTLEKLSRSSIKTAILWPPHICSLPADTSLPGPVQENHGGRYCSRRLHSQPDLQNNGFLSGPFTDVIIGAI